MADVLGYEIRLGDFVVRRKYGDLIPARVVRVTKKRVALAYAVDAGCWDPRTGGVSRHAGVTWDRSPIVKQEYCVILERGQPEIRERLKEWNKIISCLRPPLPEFLGRPEEDVAYWTKNRVCNRLEK